MKKKTLNNVSSVGGCFLNFSSIWIMRGQTGGQHGGGHQNVDLLVVVLLFVFFFQLDDDILQY